ncbi:MAG TPA: hypothetical protein VF085_05170 [Solirubrobacterales bacterium]
MRRVSKTLPAALAVLLVALGLAACGGSDSSGSTATGASGPSQAESNSDGGGSKQSDATTGGEGTSGSGGAGTGGSGAGGNAADFVPRHHNDSGGGSRQFEVKGGDNSVQEFGAEADTSELDAAATALHNFLDARAEGNQAAACEYMSKPAIESLQELVSGATRIEDKSCAGILEKVTNPAAEKAMKAEAAKADVGSLRVEGDQSFVIYTGIAGTVMAMPMANEDGDWKVTSLAGTPLS